jgi:hypothetical protein
MALEQVRDLLRRSETRRSRSRAALVILTVGSTGLTAYLAVIAQLSMLRVGQVLLGTGLAVLFSRSWRDLAGTLQNDDITTCSAFLRRRLVARRDAAQGGWLWRAAPVGPGMAVILMGLALAAHQRWPSLAVMLGLIVAWLGVMSVIMRREQARVEAEIADLDRLTGG